MRLIWQPRRDSNPDNPGKGNNSFRDWRLTIKRRGSIYGGRNRTRTGTAFRPKVFKTFACYLFRHSPIEGVLGTGRHP